MTPLKNWHLKKADLLLILALLSLLILPLIYNELDKSAAKGSLYAEITLDNKIIAKIPLVSDEQKGISAAKHIPIHTPHGENIIEVKNGSIAVSKADCPDKLCVHKGEIHAEGEIIACLPHKLLIVIKERQDE